MEVIQKLKNTRSSEYIRQLRADAYAITKSIDSNYRKLFWNNLKKVLTNDKIYYIIKITK